MNYTVLVIEDNPLNMELVRDILEANDYRVLQASTAEEGINLAREHLPDIVLMDLSLPGMDGLAATKILRAEPATSHLTIVALTAHAMRGDKDGAMAAGSDDYLAKPLEISTFAACVSWFIAAGQAEQR